MQSFAIYQLSALLLLALLSPLIRSKKWMKKITFGVLTGLFISAFFHLFYVHQNGPYVYRFGNYDTLLGIAFKVDAFNTLMLVFITGFAWTVHLYSMGYLKKGVYMIQIPEYYGLFAMLYFGMFGLLYTNDLFNTYVFIEILSIATCALISVSRKKRNYMAAFRYLMLNELGSLSFLMGVALIYMVTGALNLEIIASRMETAWTLYPVNVTLAIGFIGIGLAIKAAIFPFHEWLPDAYSTASAPSSAVLSGLMGKLYLLTIARILFNGFGKAIAYDLRVPDVMMFFAGVAMIMGSLFALSQKDLRRMLAYSSVSQVGYILLSLSLLSLAGLEVMILYIFSHALLKGLMFLITGSVEYFRNIRQIDAYQGLVYVMPFSMIIFAIAAFGMVGIPGTSGFISKWQLSLSFLNRGLGSFIILIIISSILSAIYYFPVLIKIFLTKKNIDMRFEKIPLSMLLASLLFIIVMVTLGIFPNLFIPWIEAAAIDLGGF